MLHVTRIVEIPTEFCWRNLKERAWETLEENNRKDYKEMG